MDFEVWFQLLSLGYNKNKKRTKLTQEEIDFQIYTEEMNALKKMGYSKKDAEKLYSVRHGKVKSEYIVGGATEDDLDCFNKKYLNENTARKKDYFKDMYKNKVKVNGENLSYFSEKLTNKQVIKSYIDAFDKYYVEDSKEQLIEEVINLLTHTKCERDEKIGLAYKVFNKYIKKEMELDPLIIRKNPKLVKIATKYDITFENVLDKLAFEISLPLTNIIYIRDNIKSLKNVNGLGMDIDEYIEKVEYDEQDEFKKAKEELIELLTELNNDLRINPDKFKLDL